MAAIRIYLDEDVHTFIANALRLRGWDALTTTSAARLAGVASRHGAASFGLTPVVASIGTLERGLEPATSGAMIP